MQNDGHDTHGEFDGSSGPFDDSEIDWDEDDDCLPDDTTDEWCPRCGDDSGSCVCYVVLLWEGEWLRSGSGDIVCSSLDRVLQWGHGLSLAGAPPSRSCGLLAGLPEFLAANIESYWVDVAAKVDQAQLDSIRKDVLKDVDAGTSNEVPVVGAAIDPSDIRHPAHESFLERLVDRFDGSVLHDPSIRMKRIDVHCSWAAICAAGTSTGRHRSDGVGCSSVWNTFRSSDPYDTWNRMEAMLAPVLAELDR